MTLGLVLGIKPKPEFLPLFNLGEPVTTGDAELVTGGMEQSRTTPYTGNLQIGALVNGPFKPQIRVESIHIPQR